jgi:hypothetical protein
MTGLWLKSFVVAATTLAATQAGAQVSLPLPAEIDAADPEYRPAGDKPTGNDNTRRLTDAQLEAAYSAAMKKCNGLKKAAEKSVCAAQAEAEKAKGKADINASPRVAPKK